ncbi:MAG: DNA-binding response regulator [Nitriliruptor sp.]|nr:MAG: DNA-binding response regulator [Nitriliruptor sp.]
MVSRPGEADQSDDAACNLLVADDRPVVRAGLVALLHPFTVVDAVAMADLVDALLDTDAQLLVAGVRDDQPAAFQAIAKATTRRPELRVLVVANSASVIELREAVIAGVDSFLLMGVGTQELHQAVRQTAAGERVIAPSIAMQLASSWSSEPSRTGAAAVTERELEVLRLVAEGLTNDQISDRLELPSRTVKTHVQNVLAKLEVPDRTAAVARALRLGLIT